MNELHELHEQTPHPEARIDGRRPNQPGEPLLLVDESEDEVEALRMDIKQACPHILVILDRDEWESLGPEGYPGEYLPIRGLYIRLKPE